MEGAREIDVISKNSKPVSSYHLNQNYPNPFNPGTTIEFAIPEDIDYKLSIFNVKGQCFAVFNGHANSELVKITWRPENLASGIYLYKLEAGSFIQMKKMILLK